MADLNLYTGMGDTAGIPPLVFGNYKNELVKRAGAEMRARVHGARHTGEIVPAVQEIANTLCRLFFDFDGETESNEVNYVRRRRDMVALVKIAARLLRQHFLPPSPSNHASELRWILTQSETSTGMHLHFPDVMFVDTSDVTAFVKMWRMVSADRAAWQFPFSR